jgi:hypothetical protein
MAISTTEASMKQVLAALIRTQKSATRSFRNACGGEVQIRGARIQISGPMGDGRGEQLTQCRGIQSIRSASAM